jgi:hypothetical protein
MFPGNEGTAAAKTASQSHANSVTFPVTGAAPLHQKLTLAVKFLHLRIAAVCHADIYPNSHRNRGGAHELLVPGARVAPESHKTALPVEFPDAEAAVFDREGISITNAGQSPKNEAIEFSGPFPRLS